MVTETNEAAIRRWGAIPRSAHEQFGPEGDFCRQHLLNPALWRMLGDVTGRRVLDAGSGQGLLSAIPDWRAAMRACISALDVGGVFVFSVNHPCFEQLWTTWREHGVYRTDRYLQEYEIPATYAADFHRPLSAYLNELAGLGCRIREIAEPGLDPAVAADAAPGVEAYVDLPNFLVVCAKRGH